MDRNILLQPQIGAQAPEARIDGNDDGHIGGDNEGHIGGENEGHIGGDNGGHGVHRRYVDDALGIFHLFMSLKQMSSPPSGAF
jgi:hypothetical protein